MGGVSKRYVRRDCRPAALPCFSVCLPFYAAFTLDEATGMDWKFHLGINSIGRELNNHASHGRGVVGRNQADRSAT